MAIPIRLPDLETGDEPVFVGDWLVESGQQIEVGDHLVEISVPGVIYVVSANSSGILGGITEERGTELRPGDVIAWLDSDELPSGSDL